jgi:hypothetical protein
MATSDISINFVFSSTMRSISPQIDSPVARLHNPQIQGIPLFQFSQM